MKQFILPGILTCGLCGLLSCLEVSSVLESSYAQASVVTQDSERLFSEVETGQCGEDDVFAIAIHGGAIFSRTHHDDQASFARKILSSARELLFSGARGIDVVEEVIVSLQNSGKFNAGKGSIANQAGVVEMDASIMDGLLPKAGAVASVERTGNPISAARLVMDHSRHVMLVGPDADEFVQQHGGRMVDANYLLYGGYNFSNVPLPNDIKIIQPDDSVTQDLASFSGAWGGVFEGNWNTVLIVEELQNDKANVIYALGPHPYFGEGQFRRLTGELVDGILKIKEPDDIGGFTIAYRLNPDGTLHEIARKPGEKSAELNLRRIEIPKSDHDGGTVGAVVRDRCGDLSAGTSTGGYGSKIPGRVGDSPIIGAGTYANNETAAVSATGHGEYFMRHVVAYDIAARMKYTGASLKQSATMLIEDELFKKGLKGGVIAVDKEGIVTMTFNTEGMLRGMTTHNADPVVKIFE